MRFHWQRPGYTLRELLVVVTLFCLLLAIIVPSVRTGRENALRMQCSNNLRQTGLSLQNYHDTFRQFPPGALHSGMAAEGAPPINAGLGPSWWYGLIPFQEKGTLYDELWLAQQAGAAEFTADAMTAAGLPAGLLTGAYYMLCPASPLSPMESPTGPILLPSYVGIAGGCDIDPEAYETRMVRELAPDMVLSGANGLYQNRAKGTGAAAGGIVTNSGMLPPCESIRMADCTDGISNTMIVAEQSDWLRDRDRASGQKYRGDAGWTVGGTGAGGGFLSGTRRVDPVPEVIVPGGPPSPWGADCWNLTVVRYPPNRKHVLGPSPLPGCSENHGINNPLQSAHRGGLFVVMVDGSVHFLEDGTDLEVLLRLAIRDDNPDHPTDPAAPPHNSPWAKHPTRSRSAAPPEHVRRHRHATQSDLQDVQPDDRQRQRAQQHRGRNGKRHGTTSADCGDTDVRASLPLWPNRARQSKRSCGKSTVCWA